MIPATPDDDYVVTGQGTMVCDNCDVFTLRLDCPVCGKETRPFDTDDYERLLNMARAMDEGC